MQALVLLGALTTAEWTTGNVPESDGQFSLKADVITAIADGPIVLRIMARYEGKQSIRISELPGCNTFVRDPRTGTIRRARSARNQVTPTTRSIKNGESVSEIVRLESDDFEVNDQDKQATAHLIWEVVRESGDTPPRVRDRDDESDAERFRREFLEYAKKERFRAAHVLRFAIKKATADTLRENVRMLEDLAMKPKKSTEDLEVLYDHVVYNRRALYQEVAAKLLLNPAVRDLHRNLADSILSSDASGIRKNALAIDYLLSPDPLEMDIFFSYWFDKPNRNWHKDDKTHILSPADSERLRKAPSPWVRMMLYYWVPDRFDSDAVKQLLHDLRNIYSPIRLDSVTPLIEDLESDSFWIRERAMRRLVVMRHSVIPTLTELLKKKMSVEKSHRIELVIKRIQALEPTVFERRILAALRPKVSGPECMPNHRAILEALAASEYESWVRNEASEYLRQIEKMRKQWK